jgi:2-polyprenyl-6-methoxyphenol hydroxylase-like FAD-dependent oxidoreductase
LQKAYDDKAPAADIKTAIAKVQAERKANAAALTKAQDELRSLLNARQEAYLMLQPGALLQ